DRLADLGERRWLGHPPTLAAGEIEKWKSNLGGEHQGRVIATDMIRMLIVGYCYGIRSERKLCEEARLHLAYRWFCRLDLDDAIPHHATVAESRLTRCRESDILRHIFERVVVAAMVMGLVKGEGFAVDASVMEANASRYHGKAPNELDWTEKQRQKRAVAEYL